MKILAISSSGGHWTQLLRISPAFEGHTVTFATTHASYEKMVPGHAFYAVPDANQKNILALIRLAAHVFRIIEREKPDMVISTGAAPGVLALFFGKLIGARTLWLESIANADSHSLSTKLVKPFADLYLTQWPHMARADGPFYKGSVL